MSKQISIHTFLLRTVLFNSTEIKLNSTELTNTINM